MTNNSRLEEADWNFMEGIVELREAIEAGKADDPRITQEFKDNTLNMKRWLVGARGELSGEKEGGGESTEQIWGRILGLEREVDMNEEKFERLAEDTIIMFDRGGMRWKDDEEVTLSILERKWQLRERALGQLGVLVKGNGSRNELKRWIVFAVIVGDEKQKWARDQNDLLWKAYKIARP